MQSPTRILGASAIKRITVAALLSFVTAGLLLRFFMVDGPSRLSFASWPNSNPLHAAMAPTPLEHHRDHRSSAQAPLPPPPVAATGATELDDGAERVMDTLLGMVDHSIAKSNMTRLWEFMKPVMARKDLFQGIKTRRLDILGAWKDLVQSIKQEEQQKSENGTSSNVHCPYSVSFMNTTDLETRGRFSLEIPCGLVLDSSITLVGLPRGLSGEFRIDLVGQKVPGEPHPPVIFHHNVRLRGDQLSPENPVIVQNTWTPSTDWEEEERCPPPSAQQSNKTVDGLMACAGQVGREIANASSPLSSGRFKWPTSSKRGKQKPWFPYAEAHPFVATLWVGWDGFHMTVDGKHITSFEYRQNLEPWMVGGVSLDGSLLFTSLIATGLPTSENLDALPDMDLELLKAPPLQEKVEMFIGVFSTGNNFERRMAVRRSWMQYEDVRSGKIAVRFFVGLHQNQQVNMELWQEGLTYGDIQLLPFVDYYNLITLKTLAICIFATKVVKAQFVMKTDDDTFVRVDEVISSVRQRKVTEALLYGLIEKETQPIRDPHSKWFITHEEWPFPQYPPWAHGPGYIFTSDIAEFVVERNEQMQLKLFKLEDVAMGAWIEEFGTSQGKNITYIRNSFFLSDGCRRGYLIAHYQNPRQMLCLWQQLRQGSGPTCC